jgi:hypothetical protein
MTGTPINGAGRASASMARASNDVSNDIIMRREEVRTRRMNFSNQFVSIEAGANALDAVLSSDIVEPALRLVMASLTVIGAPC